MGSATTVVTVLGTGTMGPGIAAAFAAAGDDVRIWGRRPERAEQAAYSAAGLVDDLVGWELADRDRVGSVMARADLAQAAEGTSLVVEAISEDADTKRQLLAEVEPAAPPRALLTSSTSGLDPDAIAADLADRTRFAVLHFWNPAHLIPLVEVIGAHETDEASLVAAGDHVQRVGKRGVRLHKFVPGFIGTRLQQAVVREAIALLGEGVASPEDIDAATRLSFGARFPVLGPLETSDFGGLDVLTSIHRYLLADLDARAEPHPLLEDLVAQGRLGVKTGHGFHEWSERDADRLRTQRDEELAWRVRTLRAQQALPSPGFA